MTTLTQTWGYTCLFCDKVASFFKHILQGAMIGWMISRQAQVNERTAELLIRSGEYRDGDYGWLLAELNAKTIACIRKEFGRD